MDCNLKNYEYTVWAKTVSIPCFFLHYKYWLLWLKPLHLSNIYSGISCFFGGDFNDSVSKCCRCSSQKPSLQRATSAYVFFRNSTNWQNRESIFQGYNWYRYRVAVQFLRGHREWVDCKFDRVLELLDFEYPLHATSI